MDTARKMIISWPSIRPRSALALLLVVLTLSSAVWAATAAEVGGVLRRAEELINGGELAEAIRLLEPLEKAHPEDERIPFLLGQSKWNVWRADREQKEHLEEARAHLRTAKELKSPYPACSFVKGLLEMDAGDYEAAVQGLREALAGKFQVATTRWNLALALYYQGLELAQNLTRGIDAPGAAIPVLREAMERFQLLAADTRLLPRERTRLEEFGLLARANLALAHLRAQNLPQAEKMFLDLIKAQPGSHLHQQNLGMLYDQQKKWDQAAACFEKALKLGEKAGFLAPHLRLGRIRSLQERPKDAAKHFEAFFARFPKSWEGHHERGLHHYRNGDYVKAIADFRSCLEIDPEAHVAMKSLADALRANGSLEEAEQWTERFKKKDREANRDRVPENPAEK